MRYSRTIYWTDMGIPNVTDGSIERADLDGQVLMSYNDGW